MHRCLILEDDRYIYANVCMLNTLLLILPKMIRFPTTKRTDYELKKANMSKEALAV